MAQEKPDIEITRREILQSTGALTTVGYTGNASAKSDKQGNKPQNLTTSFERVTSSRFIEIGVKHEGLPDEPRSFHDPIVGYSIDETDQKSLVVNSAPLSEATRKPYLEHNTSQTDARPSLKRLLSSPDPVIKTPRGFYASNRISYRRNGANVPKNITTRNVIAESTPVVEFYESPNIDVIVEDSDVAIHAENQKLSVSKNDRGELRLPEKTVKVRKLTDGSKENEDPRLKEVAGLEQETRSVSRTKVQTYNVTPVIAVNNLGEIDVYK